MSDAENQTGELPLHFSTLGVTTACKQDTVKVTSFATTSHAWRAAGNRGLLRCGSCLGNVGLMDKDTRYCVAALSDDHMAAEPYASNVLAFYFTVGLDGLHIATVVSVGPPCYGGVNGDDMLARVIPLKWEAPAITVNEVVKDRLTRRAMFTLTGSNLSNLKYSGELPIGRAWLVMAPSRLTLQQVHAAARASHDRYRGGVTPPLSVDIEAAVRHMNKHPGCECGWALQVIDELPDWKVTR